MIETSIILGFITAALFAILKMATLFVLTLSVDDFLESYVLCSAYENPRQCQNVLTQKLILLNMRLESVTIQASPERTVAHLIVNSRFNKSIQRSREYVNQ